jgi:hypothetical protein
VAAMRYWWQTAGYYSVGLSGGLLEIEAKLGKSQGDRRADRGRDSEAEVCWAWVMCRGGGSVLRLGSCVGQHDREATGIIRNLNIYIVSWATRL